MAKLENCPTCGNATSVNATLCPSCGEPLAAGWADKKTAAANSSRFGLKKIFYLVVAVVVIITILQPSEEEKLQRLKAENPAEYEAVMEQRRIARQEEISALEDAVKTVKDTDVDGKIEIYRKLTNLDPEKQNYSSELKYYQDQKRSREAEIALMKRQAEERAEREEMRKGFHCLSSWDGSHSGVKKIVEANLRDPDSFEHIETRITPVDENNQHTLMMKYRARNGFGGMNVEVAIASVSNSDCSAQVTAIQ